MRVIRNLCKTFHSHQGCPRLRTCSAGASSGRQATQQAHRRSLCCNQGSDSILTSGPWHRKVYGIIACQLVLTSIVAAVIMTHEPLQKFCATNVPFGLAMFIFPLVGKADAPSCTIALQGQATCAEHSHT